MAFLDYDGLKRYTEKLKSWVSANFVPNVPTSWAQIQREVRLGHGAVLFPVGSQLTLKHSVYGDIAMDVVSHDTVKKAKLSEDGQAQYDADGKITAVENAHTMTLMAHDCIVNLQYDSAEAMYYAESGLAAGTYNFTVGAAYLQWAAGTYQFTLTQAVPAGGQLCIGGNAGRALTALKVNSYASASSTSVIESAAITSGSEGTSLGTLGTELNHAQRISYGSNNYKESALRQMLNSDAAAGSVWTAQTYFDRPPTWAASTAGFLNGCDTDFLDAIATAVVKCSANDTYECPTSMGGTVTKNTAYEVADKIFMASATEVGLNGGGVADRSTLFQYYDGAEDADRIKTLSDAANPWWIRTMQTGLPAYMRLVGKNGTISYTMAMASGAGIAPACIIA